MKLKYKKDEMGGKIEQKTAFLKHLLYLGTIEKNV